MSDLKTAGLVTLAVVALVAAIAGVRGYLESREWRARVEVVQAEADAQLEQSRFLEREAARWEARANELSGVAGGLRSKADSLAERLSDQKYVLKGRINSVETPAELVGHPAIVQRDDLIEDLYANIVVQEEAYGELSVAYDSLSVAYTFSVDRGNSLQEALRAATIAADSLNAVLDDRPGLEPWWKPHIVVGPSAGIAGSGVPYAGVGVTVGWKIPTR